MDHTYILNMKHTRWLETELKLTCKKIVKSHHVNLFLWDLSHLEPQCNAVCQLAEPRPGFLFYSFLYRFRLCHDLANQFWSQSKKAANEASSPSCQPGTSHKIVTSSQPTSMTNYNWHHTDNVSVHHMFSRILKLQILNCLFLIRCFFFREMNWLFQYK